MLYNEDTGRLLPQEHWSRSPQAGSSRSSLISSPLSSVGCSTISIGSDGSSNCKLSSTSIFGSEAVGFSRKSSIMYQEIRSVANFLCQFLFTKLPRRRVCIFAEALTNNLVLRLHGCAPIHNVHGRDAIKTLIPIVNTLELKINVEGWPVDLSVQDAAASTGLDVDEVLHYIPRDLMIWLEPSEVSYKFGHDGPRQPLYNARDGTSLVSSGSTDSSTKTPISGIGVGVGDCSLRLSDRIRQQVTQCHTLNVACLAQAFELATPNDHKFTAAGFAITRFGSMKKKLDLVELKRIQQQAGVVNGEESNNGHWEQRQRSTPGANTTLCTPSPSMMHMNMNNVPSSTTTYYDPSRAPGHGIGNASMLYNMSANTTMGRSLF